MDQILYPCPGCGRTLEILLGSLATEADRTGRPPCHACLGTPPPLRQDLKATLLYGTFATIRAARLEILKLPWAEAWLAEGARFFEGLLDAHRPERQGPLKIWLGLERRRYTQTRSPKDFRASVSGR